MKIYIGLGRFLAIPTRILEWSISSIFLKKPQIRTIPKGTRLEYPNSLNPWESWFHSLTKLIGMRTKLNQKPKGLVEVVKHMLTRENHPKPCQKMSKKTCLDIQGYQTIRAVLFQNHRKCTILITILVILTYSGKSLKQKQNMFDMMPKSA